MSHTWTSVSFPSWCRLFQDIAFHIKSLRQALTQRQGNKCLFFIPGKLLTSELLGICSEEKMREDLLISSFSCRKICSHDHWEAVAAVSKSICLCVAQTAHYPLMQLHAGSVAFHWKPQEQRFGPVRQDLFPDREREELQMRLGFLCSDLALMWPSPARDNQAFRVMSREIRQVFTSKYFSTWGWAFPSFFLLPLITSGFQWELKIQAVQVAVVHKQALFLSCVLRFPSPFPSLFPSLFPSPSPFLSLFFFVFY